MREIKWKKTSTSSQMEDELMVVAPLRVMYVLYGLTIAMPIGAFVSKIYW
jgi:hypothetical protein